MEFVDGEMASYQLSEELKQTKHLLSNNDKFPGIFSALGKAFYDCVFNCELCRCNKTTFYLVREQLLLIASKLFDESVISQADRLSFDGQETVKKLLEKMKDAEIYFETYTKEGFLNPLLIGHKSEQRINQIISDALIATNSIVELCGGSEVLEPPTEIKLHCDIKARIDNELGGLEGLVDNQESLGKVAAELECSAVDLAVEVKETLESIEQTLLYLDEEESGEGIVMTEEQKVQIKKEVKTLLHQKVAAVAAQYNDSVLNSALLAYPLKSSPKIFEEELLGEGAFSKIYKGKYNNAMVAVKVINDGVERELLNDLKREVLMQSKIKNVPGVLQLLGADLSSKHTNMIVMQLADGTLAGAVHRNDPAIDMSILSKLALLNQISAAMAHIEGFDMVHRDLTAENIFVLVQSRGRAVVKISNFAVPPKVSVTTAPAGVDPATVDVSQEAEVVSRTSAYTAPELFYKHRYSISSDVYAFAVIMNELLIEKIPFDGITESEKIMSLTIAGTRPDLYDADDLVGKKLRSLVRISWNHDKKKRPDFAQINRSLKQLLEKSKHTARRGVNTVNSTSFTEKLLGMDDEELEHPSVIPAATYDEEQLATESTPDDVLSVAERRKKFMNEKLAPYVTRFGETKSVTEVVVTIRDMFDDLRGSQGDSLDESDPAMKVVDTVAIAMLDQVAGMCTNADNLEEFGKSNDILKDLISLAQAHLDSKDVSERAVSTIKLLCRYGISIDTQNTNNISQLSQLGGCDLLVEILKRHGDESEHTSECGLFAIGNMSNSAENTSRFTELGARELTVSLLLKHGLSNLDVAQNALFAIGNLNIKSTTQTIPSEAADLVVQLLKEHGNENASIAKYGSFAIASLTLKNDENVQYFAQAGVCETLVPLLADHKERNPAVSQFLLLAISKLAGNTKVSEKFGELGACEEVVLTIATYGEQSMSITENGMAAICNLSCNNSDNVEKFNKLEALELTVKLLNVHGARRAAIADTGLGAICNLSVNYFSHESMKYGVGSKEACKLIIKMLHSHGVNNISVADNGLGAICNLSNKNKENKTMFGALLACDLVMDMIKLHGYKRESIVDNGLGAITNLTSGHEENTRRFETLGAVPMLVAYLNQYGLVNRSIASEGILSIMNFADDAERAKILCRETNILESLLTIVEKYLPVGDNHSDPKIGMRAIRCLNHLTNFKKQSIARQLLALNCPDLLKNNVVENPSVDDQDTKALASSVILKVTTKRSRTSLIGLMGSPSTASSSSPTPDKAGKRNSTMSNLK